MFVAPAGRIMLFFNYGKLCKGDTEFCYAFLLIYLS